MPVEQAPATERLCDSGPIDRVVTVRVTDGAWRVCAAHMEPLLFRGPAEAERAARRVAQTLSRLGFDARLEIHDEAGGVAEIASYPAQTELDLQPPPRRQLHS